MQLRAHHISEVPVEDVPLVRQAMSLARPQEDGTAYVLLHCDDGDVHKVISPPQGKTEIETMLVETKRHVPAGVTILKAAFINEALQARSVRIDEMDLPDEPRSLAYNLFHAVTGRVYGRMEHWPASFREDVMMVAMGDRKGNHRGYAIPFKREDGRIVFDEYRVSFLVSNTADTIDYVMRGLDRLLEVI